MTKYISNTKIPLVLRDKRKNLRNYYKLVDYPLHAFDLISKDHLVSKLLCEQVKRLALQVI